MEIKFFWPPRQKFYKGTLGRCHDKSMTANVDVPGGPTFWIVPYQLIRNVDGSIIQKGSEEKS